MASLDRIIGMNAYTVKEGKQRAQHKVIFNSLASLCDYNAAVSLLGTGAGWHRTVNKINYAFKGAKTPQEALKLAVHGWPEGAERINQLMVIAQDMGARKHSTRYDVAGDTFDPFRHAAGLPDYMSYEGEASGKKKVVRLAVNLSASCAVPNAHLENYGAALLSLVDALESKGLSVELTSYSRSKQQGQSVTVKVGLKRAGEPLDVERVAYALVHPSFYRTMIFCVFGMNPKYAFLGGGLGQPDSVKSSEIEDDDVILIDGVEHIGRKHVTTPESARDYMIARINAELGEDILEVEG